METQDIIENVITTLRLNSEESREFYLVKEKLKMSTRPNTEVLKKCIHAIYSNHMN